MRDLEIIIKPTLDNTRESMGYDENEDYNLDDVLYQQGYDMDVKEVSPGDRFSIDENYLGQIDQHELGFKLDLKGFDDQDDQDEDLDVLQLKSGEYLYHDDGKSLIKIK